VVYDSDAMFSVLLIRYFFAIYRTLSTFRGDLTSSPPISA
jgi:hypothetical protein